MARARLLTAFTISGMITKMYNHIVKLIITHQKTQQLAAYEYEIPSVIDMQNILTVTTNNYNAIIFLN